MHTIIIAPCAKKTNTRGFTHAGMSARTRTVRLSPSYKQCHIAITRFQIDHLSHSQQSDLVNLQCQRRLCHCQTCTQKPHSKQRHADTYILSTCIVA